MKQKKPLRSRSRLKTRAKGLAPDIRNQCFSRDEHCQRPGCQRTDGLHPHHIKTKGSGGKDVLSNLITLCWEHHREAHDKPEWMKYYKNLAIGKYGPDYWQEPDQR